MRHVPIAEFKDRLSELIAAAEAGEELVLTRHGKPTVRILPAEETLEARRKRAREAFARMGELREKMRAEGRTVTIDEIIAWKNEGRP
jgi:prevent-host-death family protein